MIHHLGVGRVLPAAADAAHPNDRLLLRRQTVDAQGGINLPNHRALPTNPLNLLRSRSIGHMRT